MVRAVVAELHLMVFAPEATAIERVAEAGCRTPDMARRVQNLTDSSLEPRIDTARSPGPLGEEHTSGFIFQHLPAGVCAGTTVTLHAAFWSASSRRMLRCDLRSRTATDVELRVSTRQIAFAECSQPPSLHS